MGERLGVLLQFPRGAALGLVERLSLALQRRHFLLQPRLVEQVRIAGQDSHVFREVHARLLVHRTLVDGSRTHRPAFEL